MLSKSVEELYRKIEEANSTLNADSIPNSDVFLRKMESTLGISIGELRKIISILRDCHKILIIELEKGNDIKALASEFFDVAQSGANYLESLGLNINIENQTHIKKLEDRGIVR